MEDDLRKVLYSQLKEELLVDIRKTMRQEIQPIVDRLHRVEKEISVISALKTQASEMRDSLGTIL